jgi:pSer/pThr/pTyr-binding forkhead associated (FHA) protein
MSATILLALRLLLAVSLYAFLGLVLVTVWKDLRKQTRRSSAQSIQEIILDQVVESGTESLSFTIQKINIGRDPTCELILDDSTVSARHACLNFRQGHWWVEDLGSKNGTFINGQLLEASTVITDGDKLSCGSAELYVSFSPASNQSEYGSSLQ